MIVAIPTMEMKKRALKAHKGAYAPFGTWYWFFTPYGWDFREPRGC